MDVETYGFRMSNRQRRNTSMFTAAKGSETRRRTTGTSPGESKDHILVVERRRRGGSAVGVAETEARSCFFLWRARVLVILSQRVL